MRRRAAVLLVPFAVFGAATPAAAALEVVATEANGCPSGESVEARLRTLAPQVDLASQRALAVVVVTDKGGLVVSLRRFREDGAPDLVDEKVLEAPPACADRTDAAAALLATWLGAPPSARIEGPPPRTPDVQVATAAPAAPGAPPWQLAFGAGALWALPLDQRETGASPGVSIDLQVGRGVRGWRALLVGWVAGQRSIQFVDSSEFADTSGLGDTSAQFGRLGLRAGPAYVIALGRFRFTSAVQLGVSRLHAEGRGFSMSQTSARAVPDLAVRTSVLSPPLPGLRALALRVFVTAGLAEQLGTQVLVSEMPRHERALARTRAELVFGLEIGPGSVGL